MIRILLLLGFIFYSFPSLAKTVYANGKYRHNEEISTKEGCDNALQRAKLDATQKGIGMTISSEELEKCSQIDGESNCERNQFFLATFNADFTDIEVLDKPIKKTETLSDGDISYICEIKIKAEVEPIKQINDPNFNFNVELNSHNFKPGDELAMEIGFNSHMYFTIFQVLPYKNQGNQVYKLFPNEREENNYIESKKITLPYNAKYEVYFPEQIKKKNIDEYLFFLGSDEPIKWLDEYSDLNDLKSSYINSKNKVKTKYKQYTIYR